MSRPPEFAAIQRGESLQMPISLLAIERLFGMSAAGACYSSRLHARDWPAAISPYRTCEHERLCSRCAV